MGSGHTVLGIGISAVHDAVLRGVARIPGKLFDCFFFLSNSY